ncbi:MAG: hypothetical protein R3F40_05005 [Candidatus Competibacteraceae bacterium]
MRPLLERQKYLIDYTLAALLRRKTRNLGLLLVYTLLVFLFASVLLLSQGLRREAMLLLQANQRRAKVLIGACVLPRSATEVVAWIPCGEFAESVPCKVGCGVTTTIRRSRPITP